MLARSVVQKAECVDAVLRHVIEVGVVNGKRCLLGFFIPLVRTAIADQMLNKHGLVLWYQPRSGASFKAVA